MGSSHKKAARDYQQAHPGVTFPEAKRAVAYKATAELKPWISGQIPWIRTLRDCENLAPCYLCGKRTVLRSFSGDMKSDHGRVQVYCDNDQCDARETEVIVVRDGTKTTPERTDVRIMEQFEPVTNRPSWTPIEEHGDWIPGATPAARTEKTVCLFCGEQTCISSPADVPADTGRLRLRCTNPRCSVSEVEVLVMRDGTGWTQERADVKALDAIVPRRPGTRVAGIEIFSVSDLREPPEGVDELALRLSGPVPWE